MMWMVLGSLLFALALQAIGRYWTSSVVYLMKNDIAGVVTIAHGMAIDSGALGSDQIAAATEMSAKSPGVTISWGLASSAGGSGSTAAAIGGGGISLASSVTPLDGTQSAASVAPSQTSYLLVAEHPGAPNLVVLYFFSDVGTFRSGSSMVITDGQMPALATDAPVAPAPAPTSTAAATDAATSSQPSAAPTSTPAPTPSTAPAPQPSAASGPATVSGTSSSSKYPLCHQGVMLELPWSAIRNGFGGQGAGHKDDIIPPIPDYSFPGRNWDAAGMAVFANGCKPL